METRPDSPDAPQDGQRIDLKQFSPSAGRNKDIIAETLSRILPDQAHVLEIASGTGEHGAAACVKRPDLFWQPSEADTQMHNSIKAWSEDVPGGMALALSLDVTQDDWSAALPSFDAVFCANMIHIAPWSAAIGLIGGTTHCLRDKGLFILYGPFKDGIETAPSNLDFDRSLKSRNPEWGVRALDDVIKLSYSNGLELVERVDMPANNLIMAFTKEASA